MIRLLHKAKIILTKYHLIESGFNAVLFGDIKSDLQA